MTPADLSLRNLTYELFVELGRAPTVAEVALAAGTDEPDVEAGWQRLHVTHALVIDAAGALRMANPFSAIETPHRVQARGRWWFANCAWDSFGILDALHVDGRIETACADCGDPMSLEVAGGRPDDETLLFHCLVPAAGWWDDIAYT